MRLIEKDFLPRYTKEVHKEENLWLDASLHEFKNTDSVRKYEEGFRRRVHFAQELEEWG